MTHIPDQFSNRYDTQEKNVPKNTMENTIIRNNPEYQKSQESIEIGKEALTNTIYEASRQERMSLILGMSEYSEENREKTMAIFQKYQQILKYPAGNTPNLNDINSNKTNLQQIGNVKNSIIQDFQIQNPSNINLNSELINTEGKNLKEIISPEQKLAIKQGNITENILWNEDLQSYVYENSQETIVQISDGNQLLEYQNHSEQNEFFSNNIGKELANWLQRNGPINKGKNSCGASTAEILNTFFKTMGVPKLIQQDHGRHGKNFDEILTGEMNKLHEKVKVKEIPINFPSEAPLGSVIVFDEGAKAKGASKARKKYGHTEVVGPDGFYSYYKSPNPGGSARAPQSGDPKKYQALTGFTGKAYVFELST